MKSPIPNSYWVEPGRLLAGEHPVGADLGATRARIESLLAAGVRSFIDLTEPNELESYTALLPTDVSYESHPLPDHSVPKSEQLMRDVQSALERRMLSGAAVYVHCRAGIGRTGIVVGCYLREQGESAYAALVELNRLWQQNARAARWPTVPETGEQEDYIRNWRSHPLDARGALSESGLHRLTARPLQRYRGCLVALAIGDVLGAAPAAQDNIAGGSAGEASGWTDDTGMALCAAESLLECNGFDGRDQLERYRNWAKAPAAAGAAADAVLRPVVRDVLARALWNRSAVLGSHDPAQVDPSPLARCAAPALYAAGQLEAASALGADVARVTHQAPIVVDACRLLACMITAALGGRSRDEVLSVASQMAGIPLREEVRQIASEWAGPRTGSRRPSQSVLRVLDRAVRCFARSKDFGDGMARALAARSVDPDAVCATYGALAGAYYGESAIAAGLRARVAGMERVEQLAERLFQHASVP